jgi:acetyltransferase-like isoleucine patch superfamily enzyme
MVRAKRLFNSEAKVADDISIDGPVRLGAVVVERGCRIGKYTYIGSGSRIGANTVFGSYCSVGSDVVTAAIEHPTNLLSTHPFQYSNKLFAEVDDFDSVTRITRTKERETTIIGNDVWIGAKAIIKQGINVGTGAIIGSGAVVTKDVAPYSIVGGVPSKIIRFRFDTNTIEKLLASEWWRLDPLDLSGIPFDDVISALAGIAAKLNLVVAKNTLELADTLNNKVSGSGQGSICFQTSNGYADSKGLSKFSKISIKSVNTQTLFQGSPTVIPIGNYSISSAIYDEARDWYRVNFLVDDNIFSGPIGKGALRFSFLE